MDIWIPLLSIGLTALVTWVGIPVTRWLSKRDARSQIKADCELYAELDDRVPHKRLLSASIDLRVRELAIRDIAAVGIREHTEKWRKQRVEGVCVVVGGLALVSVSARLMGSESAPKWTVSVTLVVGAICLILGSYLTSAAVERLRAVQRNGAEQVSELVRMVNRSTSEQRDGADQVSEPATSDNSQP
ncbi:hypothetical protein ACPCXD_07695 [Rhodococcus sp. AB351]|uniref:hypothetical protein n=1 Tax=Rhodococcus sp. AB351 TaxID=3413280 RepID=UPI003C25A82D